MGKVVRFGVSFEPALLSRFDAMIKDKGYKNRSEAIRDIVRGSLTDTSQTDQGVIIALFDPRTKPYQNKIADIENEYHCLVRHSSRRFIDHHTGLLIIDVCGKKERIDRFLGKLRETPGVRNARFEHLDKKNINTPQSCAYEGLK